MHSFTTDLVTELVMVSVAFTCTAVQAMVDGVLARWNALAPNQAPAALGERLEELFLEASMLEAVRTQLAQP